MTEQQKSIIKTLREQNFSYNAIAKAMGVTVATVKSYCQRAGLAGNRKEAFKSQSDTPLELPTFCIYDFTSCRHDTSRVYQLCEFRQTLIGYGNHTHIRLNRTKRKVCCLCLCT